MPYISDMALPPSLVPAIKRKRTDDELSPSSPDTPIPEKRPKVSFSPTTKVRILEDSSEKPLSLVQEEVRQALARHRQNDNIGYRKLEELFRKEPYDDEAPSNTSLRQHIIALSRQVLSLADNSGDLVHAMLNCNWVQRDDEFVSEFRHFLAVLLTTYNGYLPLVLRWLVGNFVGAPKANLPNIPKVDDEEIFERIHITLQNILTLIPASKVVIGDVLEKTFPYHGAPANDFINHMNNLLKMKSYCPDLTPSILRSIVEKTLQIDVQVAVDVDPLDEDEQEELIRVVHQAMNDRKSLQLAETQVEVEEDENDDGPDEDTPERVLKRMKESMMKLDSAIDSLFEHYEAAYRKGVAEPSNDFSQLISMFKRSILTTTGSRSIQYILFRFGQLDKTIYASFVSALLKSAFDRNLAVPVRCTAISYLSSFAARGAQLEDKIVRLLFDRLSTELEKLRQNHEAATSGPDAEKFRIYYTIFQGLMYIFCFRWRAFLLEPQEDESDDGYRWLPDIKETFNRHILSRLNPLKVCAPVLVGMFAKVTKHLNFLYLYSILETNKRVRLVRSVQYSTFTRESALSQNNSEPALQLTSQYAFEPYILPISKRWITELYINFSSVAPPGLDDEGSSDEDDDEGSDEEDGDN